MRKVAFTGSTAVGKRIMAGCAEQVKRVTLELGGKSANIVFADADIDKAAAAAPGAVFDNSGQDCCARSRVLVQRSVFDRSSNGSSPPPTRSPSATRWRPAPPWAHWSPSSTCDGCARSPTASTTVYTGTVPDGPGYWHPIMIATPADPASRVCRDEIFGPVAVVIPFDDEADAIRICNDSDYGLSGSVWTLDGAKALRVVRAMEAGAISVNSNSSVRVLRPRSAASSRAASDASSRRPCSPLHRDQERLHRRHLNFSGAFGVP